MINSVIKSTVISINEIVKKQLWMDFDLISYSGFDLLIGGTLNMGESDYLIKIKFTDVDYICLNENWRSDTSNDILKVLDGNELNELQSKVTFDPDCIVFQFIPTDIISSLFIAAKKISIEY